MKSPQRIEFLTDVLITAVEHCGYGWFAVKEYTCDGEDPYALIEELYEERPTKYRLDMNVVARGISVIRQAVLKTPTNRPDEGLVLHNARTGQRLFMSESLRSTILESSRENDAGEIDVVGALAVVECGLFGYVQYC